jgi:ectoine hydroxylase-related dioxygenase (phytanoyl-CoA dioxygenase family)
MSFNNIHLKTFKEKGFLHYKNFFFKNFINKIRYDLKIKYSELLKKHNRVINPHIDVDLINFLYKNQKLVLFSKFLLKTEKIYGLQTELFINKPKITKGHPFHQDDFFLGTGKNNSLNAWIPLVDTNKMNGCLVFCLNSHKKGILKTINNNSLNHKKNGISFFNKFKLKNINCKIGDVVFISNNIFHKSYDNKSNSRRYAIACGYIKSGASFNKGKTSKRSLTRL